MTIDNATQPIPSARPRPVPFGSGPDHAYRAGRRASRRTVTADLDAAEARYVARYGGQHWAWYVAGWTDYAVRG